MTALLDRLERSHLSSRTRDSVDRRKVYVVLTEAGEAALHWTHTQWRGAFSVIDLEDRTQLIDGLMALTTAVLDCASDLQQAAQATLD